MFPPTKEKKKNHIANKKFVIDAKRTLKIIMIARNIIRLQAIVIIPGKYRGDAYNICNLRYKIPKEFPIFIMDQNMIIV